VSLGSEPASDRPGPSSTPGPAYGCAHSMGGLLVNPPCGIVACLLDTSLLDSKFARIGARLKVTDRPTRRTRTAGVVSLDVQTDRKGQFFEIVRQPVVEAEIAVLDVRPADRTCCPWSGRARTRAVPLRPRRAA